MKCVSKFYVSLAKLYLIKFWINVLKKRIPMNIRVITVLQTINQYQKLYSQADLVAFYIRHSTLSQNKQTPKR